MKRKNFIFLLRVFLPFIFAVFIHQTSAQVASSANYTFATGTSGSLTQDMNGNPIDLSTQGNLTSPALNAFTSTMDIGFDYYFMGIRYTQFTCITRGAATLGWVGTGSVFGATPNLSSSYTTPVFAPLWVSGGFAPTQGSNLRMKVVGTAPNRTCVMEWRTFFSGGTGGATPDVIMQMRMYESTGVLEYVYNTVQLPPNYTGAAVQGTIGWINTNTTTTDNIMSAVTSLSSYTATTSVASVNNTLINASAPGTISGFSAGRYFRWTPIAPTAPSSLSFAGVNSGAMTLSWTDNSSNEFGFAIYRSDDGGTTYNYITQTGANVNTYTQTGLQPGTTYYYKIYAMSEGGFSAALSGSQATTTAGSITSNGTGSWSSASTWVGGVVPTTTDNVTIANGHTVTIDIANAACNNLTVGQGTSGILRYSGSGAAGLVVYGNVTVAGGGTFDAATSNIQTHTLAIGGTNTYGSSGSLTVNGTFDMNQVTTPTAGAGVIVTFAGAADGTVSGSGSIDFFSVTVNKGSYLVPAQNPVLNVTNAFTINAPVASATRLTITSGTFKISVGVTITPYFGSQTICATGGRLWLNHSSANVSCVGTATTTGAGAPTFQGELRIDNGTFAYGSGNNTASFSTATISSVTYGGKLVMTGGTLNIYGALAFTSSTTVSFTMSGGAINVDPQAANLLSSATNAILIGSSTSVDWSGGTMTIVDPHSAASGTVATVSLQPGGTKNITGGTLKIGDGTSGSASGAFSNTTGFALSISMGVWNLVLDNRVDLSNTRHCRVVTAVTYTSHYIYNDLTVNSNGYLMLSSGGTAQSFSVFGNLVNNGTLAGVESGSSSTLGTLVFIKTSGTQTVSGSGSFYNLATLAVSTFSTNTPSTVNVVFSQTNTIIVNQVSMVVGTLTHNNKLTIGRTGQIPTIVLGGNGITTTCGIFASVPNIDNTTYNTVLIYNTSNAMYTIGAKNEIGGSTTTLYNLLVNNPKGVTTGRNLTVVSNLIMTIGDLYIGNNSLTLGSGASNVGTLTHTSGTSGQIICGSTGTFTRWVNTTAAPTTVATTSLYPMGTSGSRRLTYVYYSATNALSTAGTVTVRHADAQGTSSMTSYTDGSLSNIDKRTNAGWIFSTGNGFALTGTISLQLYYEGAAMPTANNLLNATITDASGSALGGTMGTAGGTYAVPYVLRTGMSASNLTSATLYVGAPSANIGGVVTAIATGNWGSTSTWNTGSLPTSSDNVIIPDNITVTCAGGSGTYNCFNLLIAGNASSVVMSSANTLNVNGYFIMQGKGTNYSTQSFFNQSAGTVNVTGWDPLTGATTGNGVSILNGNFTLSGGTFNLSTSTNCNRNFDYTGGYINITGGNMNIFGKMSLNTGANALNVFQSGGTISIDPLGSSAATSCSGTANTESSFYLISSNSAISAAFSGGTIILVDPCYNNNLAGSTTNQNSVYLSVATQSAPSNSYNIFCGTHTVQLGDGVSTSTGLSTTGGFPMESYFGTTRCYLNNVVVNGGATAGRAGTTSQYNFTAYGFYCKNLTINSGSEFIHSSSYPNDFTVANALVNNGTLTQAATSALNLGAGVSGLGIYQSPSISGSGTFRNLSSSPTASFTNLNIHTGNNALKATIGVNNLSVSWVLGLTTGQLDIGTNNFTLGITSTATAATLQWTAGSYILTSGSGTFTRVFGTTSLPTATGTAAQFPLGRFNSTTKTVEDRSAHVYFSTSTALSTGGTVSIGHTHTPGYTTLGSPFTDNSGALTIDTRSNSNWAVTNSSLVATGTISLTLVGTNVNISPSTVANSTLCEASAAAGGTYAAGSNTTTVPYFNRTGMSVADITSKTFYGGIPSGNNLGGSIVAIANGYWDQTSTWSTGTVPTSTDGVDIPSPYTVMLGTGATHICKTLNIQSGGAFIANGNSLTITDRITNAGTMTIGGASIIVNNGNTATYGLTNTGTINMNAGTVRLGPTGGGAASFVNTANVRLNGGTINLNGNYAQTAGLFAMTTGVFNVDGNDGTSSAGSVAGGTDLFSITSNSGTITGGTITIVDPPFLGTGRAFTNTSGTTWTNNTLNIGDGTSSATGTSYLSVTNNPSTGFRLSTAAVNVGNVYIKGGSTTNRWASICNSETFVCTNLSIAAGSELRTITNSTATLTTTGNTSVGSGGYLTVSQLGTWSFTGTATQTVTSSGTICSDTAHSNTGQVYNMTVNNSSGTGVDISSIGNLTIGYGTTAAGTLTLTAGPLNIGTNTLTLGTSGTLTGTLSLTSGAIIHSSGGKFQRWISATAAPTAVGTTSQYPLGVLSGGTLMRRDVYIYFASATLTGGTAGTLTASHSYTAGLTSVSSFTDGSLSGIDTRTNGYWTVGSANSFSEGSTTISVTAQGTGMVSPTTIANITLMDQSAALGGTYAAGSNTSTDPRANRTGMSLANLTGATRLYIGGPGTNLYQTIQSIASGNWSSTSTWSTGTVPTSTDNVIINSNHTITLDASGNTRDLTLNSGSVLNINANTLTVNNNLTNTGGNIVVGGGTLTVVGSAAAAGFSTTGTVALNSGTINVGNGSNYNRTFTLSSGTLAITGGTLNVNGNIVFTAGTFTMGGGAINVDGNDGTGTACVASGTNLFAIASGLTHNVTGGTITIVDPPYTGTGSAFYYNSSTSVTWTGNTLRLGDGTSTTSGSSSTLTVGSVANTLGFNVVTSTSTTTGRLRLYNVIVNGGSGTNRFTTAGQSSTVYSMDVGNDLTINSSCELRTLYGTSAGGAIINVGGNLTNNGILVTGSYCTLGLRFDGSTASTNAQTISGSGTFTNVISGTGTKFSNLLMNNTNTNGVTMSSIGSITIDDPNGITPNLTLTAGYLNLGNNNITIGSSTSKPGSVTVGAYAGATVLSCGLVVTTGSFTRWFSANVITMPTVAATTVTNAGLFPLGVISSPSAFNRSVALSISSALTTGGTVTVSHSNASGVTTGFTSYTDGGVTVDTRTNFNWTISTGGGFAASGTNIGLQVMGSGLQTGSFANLANLRNVAASAAYSGSSGTNLNTFADPVVVRSGLDHSTLAATTYIGGPGVITAIANNNVYSSQTICMSTAPSAFTGSLPTGGNGSYSYQWQSSTTSATLGFSDVSGATGQNYSPGTLSQTTWYRRYVTSASYVDTSASLKITVNASNTWLGATSTAWATASNWQCGYVPTSTSTVVINSGTAYSPVISTTGQVCDNLIIGAGATLTINNSSSQLTIGGTFTNHGTLTFTNGEMVFGGTSEQPIPSGTYSKITLNNSTWAILSGNVTVNGDVDLQAGMLILGSYNLTITGTTGIVTNSSSSKHIVTSGTGALKIQNIGSGGRTGAVTFPIGPSGSAYNPVQVTNSGTSDEFAARVYTGVSTSYSSNVANGTSITSNIVGNTWIVNEGTNGGSNVTLTLQWNGSDELGGFTRSNCNVAHYTGGVWVASSSSAASGSNPYTQTRTGITSFSPFGVHNNGGPLPVSWLSFTGRNIQENVELNWSTASEINNSHFELERSIDMRNFVLVASVNGKGTTNEMSHYDYLDVNPFGAATTLYYRLKQVDYNGEYEYSSVIAVSKDKLGNGVTIETINPNPFTQQLSVTLNQVSEGNVAIAVYDLSGKVLYTHTQNTGSGKLVVDLKDLSNLPEGVYILSVTNGSETIRQKLVKVN